MTEEINAILDNISSKLGLAVSEVYGILMDQVRVETLKATIGIFVCSAIIAVSIFYVYLFFFKKGADGMRKIETYSEEDEFSFFVHIILLVIAFISCFAAAFIVANLTNTIIQIVTNPEYWALSKIFGID